MSGFIDISQLHTPPEAHELKTAQYFANMGKDICFIQPSNIPGIHRPDILMDGVEWEIKSPEGKSKRTIEKNYRIASLQSKYIIFDLRRINVPENQCLSQLKHEFLDKKTRRLLIITKGGTLIMHSADS